MFFRAAGTRELKGAQAPLDFQIHVSSRAYLNSNHFKDLPCPNISTTPLRQWGFRQCLPISWTTLRDKHYRHPIAAMEVVDTFGPY